MKQFDRIEETRRRLGRDLVTVGHHYQCDEVIRHTDMRGDSLQLARETAKLDVPHIMFCGVYFMAESAALLARDGCQVHLPEPSAECSMALMSPEAVVENVLDILTRRGRKIVPLAYVNSTLAVKAVVGRHHGSVCTSANAKSMLSWALGQGDGVLFLPDMHLGMNTADILGMLPKDLHVLDVRRKGQAVDCEAADRARLLLWPGFCSIHTHFLVRHVEAMRDGHPGARVVVHPECTPDVVAASDAAGSTSFIIRSAAESPDGASLGIGTEINLVRRLEEEHKGRVSIFPLDESSCPHMAQTTEESLAAAMEALALSRETRNPSPYLVRVPEEFKAPAKEALERMLDVCRS
jgi:quinolinate synthase